MMMVDRAPGMCDGVAVAVAVCDDVRGVHLLPLFVCAHAMDTLFMQY